MSRLWTTLTVLVLGATCAAGVYVEYHTYHNNQCQGTPSSTTVYTPSDNCEIARDTSAPAPPEPGCYYLDPPTNNAEGVCYHAIYCPSTNTQSRFDLSIDYSVLGGSEDDFDESVCSLCPDASPSTREMCAPPDCRAIAVGTSGSRTGHCWEAHVPSFDCQCYEAAGYSCRGEYCAAIDPGGSPSTCAVDKGTRCQVNSAGRCSCSPGRWDAGGVVITILGCGILVKCFQIWRLKNQPHPTEPDQEREPHSRDQNPGLDDPEQPPSTPSLASPTQSDSATCSAAALASVDVSTLGTPNTSFASQESAVGVVNPIGGASEAPHLATLPDFLANLDLAQYAPVLEDLGVTEVAHVVDVAAEDLQGIMKPLEARRFLRVAGESLSNSTVEL